MPRALTPHRLKRPARRAAWPHRAGRAAVPAAARRPWLVLLLMFGVVVLSLYDGAGRAVKVTLADPATGTITGSSPTILTAYDENNNVTRVTNPLGANTTYAYDARNRKLSETLPAAADWSNGGTPGARVTAWGYDAAGNTLNVTTNLTHNTPSVTAMEYDAANRVTYTFTPGVQVWNGTGATGAYLATNTSYDDNGNVLMVQQGTATSQGHAGFSASRNTTVNTYDALNRLVTTTDGAGITVGYGYDEAGNRVLVSDGLSHNTTFSYDGLNRVVVIDYPVGNNTVYAYGPTHVESIFNGHATTYFGYDQRERVTGRTGYNFYYDRAGELVGAEAWDWDAVHELGLTRYSDVSYAYDGLGRVIAENQGGENSGDIPEDVFGDHFAGNITGGVTNTYAYDAAGNRLAAHYDIAGGNRTLNSTYDALNRVANITDVTSGNLVTAYHYDLGGRRNGLLYPSGSNITTGFDALGRQTAITGAGNATTTRYALALDYDEFNNLGRQAETYANGMLASRNVTLSYDGADRLTREVLARSGGATITSNYTYDAAYNRTAKVTSNTSNSTIVANVTYHFNDGNQLDWFHDVTANTTANYTYDGAGNRLTLSFNGHDAGGNYNYTNTAVYYYDAANRLEEADLHTLVAASSNHTTQRYAEDFYLYGYDHRTRRTSMGQERLELSGNYIRLKEGWFDGGSPIRQSDSNYTLSHTPTGNVTTREFIRGSDWGGGVGGILYSLAGNATTAKYYHYDGRGDVVAQTGNTGAVTYQAEYDAYGKHDNVAAKGTQTSGTNNDPFQANTKEEDPTGFVNMGFRMYDLETGVFTTPDPLGYGDGLNRYTFVHQNSWSKFDPEGLQEETERTEVEMFAEWLPTRNEAMEREEITKNTELFKQSVRNAPAGSPVRLVRSTTLNDFEPTMSPLPGAPAPLNQGAGNARPGGGGGSRSPGYSGFRGFLPAGSKPLTAAPPPPGEFKPLDLSAVEALSKGEGETPPSGGAKEVKQSTTGVVYKVSGSNTPSGKPYIGRTSSPEGPPGRGKLDGRDRTGAEIVDTYETTPEGKVKEQKAMDANGGLVELDNKRNEIADKNREKNGLDPR